MPDRGRRVPDPGEVGTPAGWRRAQQIRYHALGGKQWQVAADVTVAMAQHLASLNDFERAEKLLTEVYEGSLYDPRDRAAAAVQLAMVYDRSHRADIALQLLNDALPALSEDSDRYAFVLMRIGIIYEHAGNHQTALEWLERAEEAAMGHPFLRAQIRDEMAMVETSRGNYGRAAELHDEALTVFEAAGAHAAVMINLAAQARLAARREDYSDANRRAVAAAEIAASAGLVRHVPDLYLDAGRWAEQAGDLTAAEQALRLSLEHGGSFDDYDAARAHYYLAVVQCRIGALAPAIYHVQELLRLKPDDEGVRDWLNALDRMRQDVDGSSQ